MTRPLGSLDFFVLEAGDCLGRIEQLVAAFETPPADDLLRAARALRGAAVLAQHAEIAEAAAGFETVGRALKSGLPWDASRRQRTHQAVESFRLVVRAATHWSEADAERARGVGRLLASVAGTEPVADARPVGSGEGMLASGVRAFIAREGALAASALADAARQLRELPEQPDALLGAARRLLALRGLGEVRELSPLPELLVAIELLADDLPRVGAVPPNLAAVADAAAAALARVCREVASDGRPSPEAADARHVVTLIFEAAAVERDVVPVTQLLAGAASVPVAPDDEGKPPMGALALVSLGEHLTQSADVLGRTPRLMQRELRGYAAVVMLRRTAAIGGAPAHGLRALLRGVRAALAAGLLREDAPRVAAALREAAGLLRQVSDATDRRTLSRQLMQIGQRLDAASQPSEPMDLAATVPEPPVGVPEIVAALPPAPAELPVVSILELLRAGESPIVPIARLAPDPPVPDLLLDSWSSYEAFLAALPTADTTVLPIGELLFRGERARVRARAVGSEVQQGMRAQVPLALLQPLMDELCDLLVLSDERA